MSIVLSSSNIHGHHIFGLCERGISKNAVSVSACRDPPQSFSLSPFNIALSGLHCFFYSLITLSRLASSLPLSLSPFQFSPMVQRRAKSKCVPSHFQTGRILAMITHAGVVTPRRVSWSLLIFSPSSMLNFLANMARF